MTGQQRVRAWSIQEGLEQLIEVENDIKYWDNIYVISSENRVQFISKFNHNDYLSYYTKYLSRESRKYLDSYVHVFYDVPREFQQELIRQLTKLYRIVYVRNTSNSQSGFYRPDMIYHSIVPLESPRIQQSQPLVDADGEQMFDEPGKWKQPPYRTRRQQLSSTSVYSPFRSYLSVEGCFPRYRDESENSPHKYRVRNAHELVLFLQSVRQGSYVSYLSDTLRSPLGSDYMFLFPGSREHHETMQFCRRLFRTLLVPFAGTECIPLKMTYNLEEDTNRLIQTGTY